ncbi:MAG: HTH domain-containing protein [Clostridia bacterium]|nr:HTH domain-containing protein [Clostridia bacterium]
MRSRFIQNEILVLLSDKKEHTAKEIANVLEISTKTVYRHINDLSATFQIVTGRTYPCRGIKLINQTDENSIFSQWEIDYLLSIVPTDIHESKVKKLLDKLYNLKQSNCSNNT